MASSPLEQLPSCKRRKVAAARPVCIYDLSAEILKEVATYLAPPSRILFPVAITPPASPYETIMARSRSKKQKTPSIVGADCATLDFGQIEKELAAKLSDEDLRDVLLHIDAANKLKKLLLTNCTNITGSGLSPLSGSTTIEYIDLSLVGLSQDPHLVPEPPISLKIVLPILESIISNEVLCKLKYLHFPEVWRLRSFNAVFLSGSSTESDLYYFLVCYNQMLENRGQVCCVKCDEELEYQPLIDLDNSWSIFGRHNSYGMQSICHRCSKYSNCQNCPVGEDNAEHYYCSVCQREYCTDCVTMMRCGICHCAFCDTCLTSSHGCASPNCDEKLCRECMAAPPFCDGCNRTWCEECCRRNCYDCDFCNKRYCHNCAQSDTPQLCDLCEGTACSTCLIERLQGGKLDCLVCIKRVAPFVFEQNKRLKDENKELKDENESMCKHIQDIEDRFSTLIRVEERFKGRQGWN